MGAGDGRPFLCAANNVDNKIIIITSRAAKAAPKKNFFLLYQGLYQRIKEKI
jgi:hypothetical protein